MSSWSTNPQDFTVYCDEQADRQLFFRFGNVEPFLGSIPQANVKLLPRGDELRGPKLASIVFLAEYDRPDLIFLYQGKPVLVVELTEHGYTGDHPLQRFTRFATTAENHLPFIYFTPFSRVRDDELDLYGGDKASKRNVNTNVWKGMTRLSEIFDVPQIALQWPLAPNGKPRKPGVVANAQVTREIFGELIEAITHLLQLAPQIANGNSIMSDPFVEQKLDKVRELWAKSNTRDSVIRDVLDRQAFLRFLQEPQNILNRITRKGYFYSDKPERLLALQCILESDIDYILTREETRPVSDIVTALEPILKEPVFDQPFVYYTGYQWRSDPHCGVAVNLDYIYCRTDTGHTPRDRVSALVVYWPRIFSSKESAAYQAVERQIDLLRQRKGDFFGLFVDRYGSYKEADKRVDQLLTWRGTPRSMEKLIGVWNENTKQARIFRHYCDILVLADAVIVGDHWQERI